MRAAYFDVFAGASGDMTLGALIDAGVSTDALTDALAALKLDGWRLSATPDVRGAIGGVRVNVEVDPAMPQPHRHLADIETLINASDLPPAVRHDAIAVFRLLAKAEARVHRTTIDRIHFHEVGAIDSIIDTVGAVLGLHLLGTKRVTVSSIPLGGGMTMSQHGLIPVPAPATIEILAMVNAPTRPSVGTAATKEMVTPTAAAFFGALGEFRQPPLRVTRVGYGIGHRNLPDVPNALRVWLGDLPSDDPQELRLLETNIDDMNPEILGYVQERLLAEGARDAWFTAAQMKRNRPGVVVSVIADVGREADLAALLLRETSTLGVRSQPIARFEADRELLIVPTALGPAQAKVKRIDGRVMSVAPEYRVCRALAEQHGVPLTEVYRIVEDAARAELAAQPPETLASGESP